MSHITAGCRCGHRSAGDPSTVVKEMQAHFLTAHDRAVPAETILARSEQLAPATQSTSADAPSSPGGVLTSRVVLGRLVGVLGRQAKNPTVASLAGILSEQLTGAAGRTSPPDQAPQVTPASHQALPVQVTPPAQSAAGPPADAEAQAEARHQLNLARVKEIAMAQAEAQAAVQQRQREQSLGLQGMQAGINTAHQARMGIGH